MAEAMLVGVIGTVVVGGDSVVVGVVADVDSGGDGGIVGVVGTGGIALGGSTGVEADVGVSSDSGNGYRVDDGAWGMAATNVMVSPLGVVTDGVSHVGVENVNGDGTNVSASTSTGGDIISADQDRARFGPCQLGYTIFVSAVISA